MEDNKQEQSGKIRILKATPKRIKGVAKLNSALYRAAEAMESFTNEIEKLDDRY